MSSETLIRITPADGTLSPADFGHYGVRDRNHVYPFAVAGPARGEIWRVDSVFVTNIHTAVAYVTVTCASNSITRSATGPGAGAQPGDLIKYGNSLQPVSHYAWGMPIEPGDDGVGIDTGGELIRGDGLGGSGATVGMGIWLGAWPGTNLNALGPTTNDGVPPGIIVAVHGERLA